MKSSIKDLNKVMTVLVIAMFFASTVIADPAVERDQEKKGLIPQGYTGASNPRIAQQVVTCAQKKEAESFKQSAYFDTAPDAYNRKVVYDAQNQIIGVSGYFTTAALSHFLNFQYDLKHKTISIRGEGTKPGCRTTYYHNGFSRYEDIWKKNEPKVKVGRDVYAAKIAWIREYLVEALALYDNPDCVIQQQVSGREVWETDVAKCKENLQTVIDLIDAEIK